MPTSERDRGLRVVSENPFNAESPLIEPLDRLTPSDLFYVRNHFQVPDIECRHWQLQISGKVRRPLTLSYDDLLALPSHSLAATMECAGNARFTFEPPAQGEPWKYGAVSTAEWSGVRLASVLEEAGVTGDAHEVLIRGADRGPVPGQAAPIRFERSLPLEKALHPDTLLAYRMNGEVLPPNHGFPVRLLAPGWYGMASVKWVTQIEVIDRPFTGFYQAERYVMRLPNIPAFALDAMQPRALITSPRESETLKPGPLSVRGVAWSGSEPVERVEVAIAGDRWEPVTFLDGPQLYAWRRWEHRVQLSHTGTFNLRSRAYDGSGRPQPAVAPWNQLGYCNNAVQAVSLSVETD